MNVWRIVGLLLVFTVALPLAQAGHHHHRITCPQCQKYCEAVPEKKEIEKKCFNVECKEICIPAITFPWQRCDGPPKCGKVISVKVLKKHKYTCESCGYKWVMKDLPCNCDACCPAAQTPPVPQPLEAPPLPPAPPQR